MIYKSPLPPYDEGIQKEHTMPSTSDKQKHMMAAAAHNPKFAKKVGVPMKVAKEFNVADTRRAKLKASMDDLEEGK
jgi:hypothetical protein